MAVETTYVRTVNTYHRRGCNRLTNRARVYEWAWPESQPGFDPIAYGRMALRRRALVQPCQVCFPECFETREGA